MGLLSNVWGAIDPFVPDEQVMGLLGRFRGPQSQPAYATGGGAAFDTPYGQVTPPSSISSNAPPNGGPPAQAPRRHTMGGLSDFLRIPGALGSAILDDLQSGPRQTREYEAMRQRIEAEAAQAGLTPEQLLALHTNPKALGEALSSHSSDVVLNQGAVRNRGGYSIAAAPVIGAAGDRTRVTDPLTGETDYSAARPPTFAETTARQAAEQAARNAQAMQAQRERDLAERAQHNRATEGTAAARVGKMGAGRGGSSHKAVPALPHGFVLEK